MGFLGLYTRWFHRHALLSGLLSGLALGTGLVVQQNFLSSIVTISLGSFKLPVYVAIIALLANLAISTGLTPLFHFLQVPVGEDETTPTDFEAHPVDGLQKERKAVLKNVCKRGQRDRVSH